MTPDLAQVRIVHSVGMVMDGGAKASAEILWPNIVSSIADKELRVRVVDGGRNLMIINHPSSHL